jgi:hypothetical protein
MRYVQICGALFSKIFYTKPSITQIWTLSVIRNNDERCIKAKDHPISRGLYNRTINLHATMPLPKNMWTRWSNV